MAHFNWKRNELNVLICCCFFSFAKMYSR